jgi:hypothetical protein
MHRIRRRNKHAVNVRTEGMLPIPQVGINFSSRQSSKVGAKGLLTYKAEESATLKPIFADWAEISYLRQVSASDSSASALFISELGHNG